MIVPPYQSPPESKAKPKMNKSTFPFYLNRAKDKTDTLKSKFKKKNKPRKAPVEEEKDLDKTPQLGPFIPLSKVNSFVDQPKYHTNKKIALRLFNEDESDVNFNMSLNDGDKDESPLPAASSFANNQYANSNTNKPDASVTDNYESKLSSNSDNDSEFSPFNFNSQKDILRGKSFKKEKEDSKYEELDNDSLGKKRHTTFAGDNTMSMVSPNFGPKLKFDKKRVSQLTLADVRSIKTIGMTQSPRSSI